MELALLGRLGVVSGLVGRRWVLWSAFLIVHVAFGLLFLQGEARGDVQNFYLLWFREASSRHVIVGVNRSWVYPLLAWLPIAIAGLAGPAGDRGYELAWLVLVIVVDSAAFAMLTARLSRSRVIAAWWWTIALAALGPVFIGRLDTVASALAVAAVVVIAFRPWLAGVLLSIATWVKVWPAALILAFAIGGKRRVSVVLAVVSTSVIVAVVSVLLGGGRYLFTFITAQIGRGLQIESPLATPWLWADASGAPAIRIYWDPTISTYQLVGPGVALAAKLSSLVLVTAVLVTLAFGIRAVIRRADASRTVAALSLALTMAVTAFNKVGSPQYEMWCVPIVIFGLLVSTRWFRTPAILVVVASCLTQGIYPYFYRSLLLAQPWMVFLITARNLLEFTILAWALIALWQAPATPLLERDAEISIAVAGDGPHGTHGT